MVDRADVGAIGEDIAAGYLKASGYEIIARNIHFGHLEIDIIARKAGCLVFVEVKTRTSKFFGTAVEAITREKVKRLLRCAKIYMMKDWRKEPPMEYRIDVIAIDIETQKGRMVLRHLTGVV